MFMKSMTFRTMMESVTDEQYQAASTPEGTIVSARDDAGTRLPE